MSTKRTCIVTLHGIGFQRSPHAGKLNSGYADQLHQHLKVFLQDSLSDDPNRERTKPGDNGPIYVQSRWSLGGQKDQSSREAGLRRLGAWQRGNYDESIDPASLQSAPLLNPTYDAANVSHVALVYSKLEPTGQKLWPVFLLLRMTIVSFRRYATLPGLLRLIVRDGAPVLRSWTRHFFKQQKRRSSLVPRDDLTRRRRKPGFMRALEDDVGCYVSENEERERVRSFVHGALMRLGYRDDVDEIILNTHSNGTVIAFDVLRYLPPQVTDKITIFSTAGSPLRKYVDLFHWGNQVQTRSLIESWHNFWDPCDPVADPLDPPIAHRVTWSNTIKRATHHLFHQTDFSGTTSPVVITDHRVDNLKNSYGDNLRAHNYWDNNEEFVAKLAEWCSR